jgi:hypothetical protein
MKSFFLGVLVGVVISVALQEPGQVGVNEAVVTKVATTLPQATIPSDRLEITIKDLQVGESGYTLPWGMWIDLEDHCWLNPDYPVTGEVKGTSRMWVERKENGYHVGRPSYVGQDGPWIPVVELR